MSREVELTFPPGSLGLELQPALSHGSLAIGCRIKGWKKSSSLTNLVPNSKIISVDGENIEKFPFSEVVEKIRESSKRNIVLQIPSVESNPKSLLSKQDDENFHPNVNIPLQLQGLPLKIKSDSLSSEAVEEEVDTSKRILQLEDEVKRALESVSTYKVERRENEGKITFLKYQLDKLKASHHGRTPQTDIIPDGHTEKCQWLLHWNKFKPALNRIMKPTVSEDKKELLPVSSSTDLQLKKKLYTQERVSFRLEMQLRTWVDSQINLQKTLAEQEAEKYFDFQRSHAEQSDKVERADITTEEGSAPASDEIKIEKITKKEAETSIVQMPLLSLEGNTFQVKARVAESEMLETSNIEVSSTPCEKEPLISTMKSVPEISPLSNSLSERDSIIRDKQWNNITYNATPPSHVVLNCDSTSARSSCGSKNKGACDESSVLSPQQYRAILSSHQKPKCERDTFSSHHIGVVYHDPTSNQYAKFPNHMEYSSQRFSSRGYYEFPHSHSHVSYKEPEQPERRFERTGTFNSSNLHVRSTMEQQNIKSRSLKDRMMRLKLESNKIRDDLRRVRSTMQEVRNECTD